MRREKKEKRYRLRKTAGEKERERKLLLVEKKKPVMDGPIDQRTHPSYIYRIMSSRLKIRPCELISTIRKHGIF